MPSLKFLMETLWEQLELKEIYFTSPQIFFCSSNI